VSICPDTVSGSARADMSSSTQPTARFA